MQQFSGKSAIKSIALPHCILVRYKSYLFLLDLPFNEEIDDYEDSYRVHKFSDVSLETTRLWERILQNKESFFVGKVNVKDIDFDETKRKKIDCIAL